MWRNWSVQYFPVLSGRVAKLVHAYVSEAYPARVGSSSLPTPTQNRMAYVGDAYGKTSGSYLCAESTLCMRTENWVPLPSSDLTITSAPCSLKIFLAT